MWGKQLANAPPPPSRRGFSETPIARRETPWSPLNPMLTDPRGLSPIDYVTLSSDPDLASLSIELSPSPILAVKDYPPSHADAVKGLHGTEMSMSRFLDELLTSVDELDFRS
jgi:hypothetical protein